jgi:hypothetical protein
VEERRLGALERQLPGDLVADRPARPSAPIRASPTRSQSAPPAVGPGSVSFAAVGPLGSKSVNHSEPVGSASGRLWTV